jgi:hypothetical protein
MLSHKTNMMFGCLPGMFNTFPGHEGGLTACAGPTALRLTLHCYTWPGRVKMLIGGWLSSEPPLRRC